MRTPHSEIGCPAAFIRAFIRNPFDNDTFAMLVRDTYEETKFER